MILEFSIGNQHILQRGGKRMERYTPELLTVTNQLGFNQLLHIIFRPSVDEESELVYAFDGILKIRILPANLFCSVHTLSR